MLEALEVNVRRAALHGVGEDRVDQLDDRRVIDRRGQRRRRDFLFAVLDDLDVAERVGGDVLEQRRHLHVRRFVVLLDEVAERELAGEHREDVVARDELEVLEDRRGCVGSAIATVSVRPSRLSGRTRCFVARSVGTSFDDARIDLEPREVDRRHPVLPRERSS